MDSFRWDDVDGLENLVPVKYLRGGGVRGKLDMSAGSPWEHLMIDIVEIPSRLFTPDIQADFKRFSASHLEKGELASVGRRSFVENLFVPWPQERIKDEYRKQGHGRANQDSNLSSPPSPQARNAGHEQPNGHYENNARDGQG